MIALGGGSPIDTAKAMGVMAANPGKMRDYKVPNVIPNMSMPLLAIPTTAGTGSEVTKFTVITDTETDEKMLIAGNGVIPQAAIVDFELTLSCPFRLTADTGIDTLTHAIEAYVSRKANPFSDSMALAAMARVARLPAHCLLRAGQPAGAGGDDAGGQPGRHRLQQRLGGAGPWHEPADRRPFPCAARPVQRDAAAGGDRLLAAEGGDGAMPTAPAPWAYARTMPMTRRRGWRCWKRWAI